MQVAFCFQNFRLPLLRVNGKWKLRNNEKHKNVKPISLYSAEKRRSLISAIRYHYLNLFAAGFRFSTRCEN